MKLEEKLVVLRKEKGLTQLKLAEMMNVSRQAVSRWEAGTAVPSTDNLKYLGNLYDVPLDYLLNDDALELIRAGLEPDKEKPTSANGIKKKRRNIMLALMAVGIVILVLSAILFGNRKKERTSMEDIEGSDIVIVDDFEMDW